jgi:hypothetical protein
MPPKFKVGDIVRLNKLAIERGDYCENCRDTPLRIVKVIHLYDNEYNYRLKGKKDEEVKNEKLLEFDSWKNRFTGEK